MSEPVRWGFLGAGWIAHRALAPAVHCADGAVLQAAAARDVTRAGSLAPTTAYGSYDALVDDPQVEAVYISLANDAHLPWTLRALAAGKHVLCEKPLGLSAAQVRQMARAAQAADRLVVEATWSRWHPRTQRANALLATGAVGQVRHIDSGFTFPGALDGNYRLDPSKGGGALYDLGPYAVGSALWAASEAPLEVVSVDVLRHPLGVDLTTAASMRLGPATASTRTSVAEGYGEWVRVVGDAGTLELDEPAHTSWLAASTLRVDARGEQLVQQFAPVDPYQRMVEHVSRAVRGDGSAFVLPITDSLRVAEALDAIRTVSP